MATIVEGVRHSRTLKYAHTEAVEAGDVIVANGNVLVAVSDADAGEQNVYVYRARVAFEKGAESIGAAVPVYWSQSSGQATASEAGNTKIGITVEAASAADDEVLASLHEN
ncbi:MAG: DUF2190 family protein [Desulfobacteraceae bacterium]|nr:DUF2190 family protein [Desulfobacteraceae bacterium]